MFNLIAALLIAAFILVSLFNEAMITISLDVYADKKRLRSPKFWILLSYALTVAVLLGWMIYIESN